MRTIVATYARVDFAPVHMHVPTGVSTCDPLSSLCIVLFMTNTLSIMAPSNRVTGHWACVVVQRPLRDEWGNVGVNGRTLAVNHVRIHYGKLC